VFSAELSAADAVLFMLTTSLSQDLYKRFLNPEASDARVLTVARLATLVSGALGVSRQVDGEWHNIHVLTKGDLAGELGFMDDRPHYAALRALGPSRVLSLEREKLESLLEREPLIVYRVMRAIFRVVHVTLNRVAIESRELTNYMFKVHGKY